MTSKPETIDEFAQHYADVIYGKPNGWGQYISPFFGQSHHIIALACERFGKDATLAAITIAVKAKADDLARAGKASS